MNCPKCAGPDFQALSFIYQQGLSFTDTSSAGLGLAGRGVGVFGAKTKGTTTTALALQAAPPAKKRTGTLVFLTIVSLLLIGATPFALIGVGLFGFAAFGMISWNKKEWPALYDAWLQRFMCLRCGTIVASLPNIPIMREAISTDEAIAFEARQKNVLGE